MKSKSECKQCGQERQLNDEGICDECDDMIRSEMSKIRTNSREEKSEAKSTKKTRQLHNKLWEQ